MIRNLIFDVDGTLWDSAAAVAEAWNEILRQHPGAKDGGVTVEEIYSYMGHTMEEIGRRMLPGLPAAQRQELMRLCMEYENVYLAAHSGQFYEGVQDCFRTLRQKGYQLYIVSNCQEGYIETMLHCGAIPYADPFYGTESGRREDSLIWDLECFGRTGEGKDRNLCRLMERNGLQASETVYVGDTEMDEAASDRAGIPMIYASYGFGTAKHPLASLSSIRELPALLDRLSRQVEKTEI